jgi:outer membrane protein TolC
MSRNSLVVVSLLAALAGACAVRTDAPETTIQPPATLATPRVSDGTFDAAWWRQFDDPVLDGLVDEAVSGNRDLRAAASRYEAALEIAGAAKAALLPSGGVTIGASRQHLALDQPGGRLMPTAPSRSLMPAWWSRGRLTCSAVCAVRPVRPWPMPARRSTTRAGCGS